MEIETFNLELNVGSFSEGVVDSVDADEWCCRLVEVWVRHLDGAGKPPIAKTEDISEPGAAIASSLFLIISLSNPSFDSFANLANAAFSASPIPFVASAFRNNS
uniref:Uncharacterized protein n=1 Tax=Cucumis melo TaxID=3656 RepID=A0A9I9EJQ8_CUCME